MNKGDKNTSEISGWTMKVAPGIYAHIIKSSAPNMWIMVLDTGGKADAQMLTSDALQDEINRLSYLEGQVGNMG